MYDALLVTEHPCIFVNEPPGSCYTTMLSENIRVEPSYIHLSDLCMGPAFHAVPVSTYKSCTECLESAG